MTGRPRTVLLLLSDKRSGSTILQDELCRHPNVSRVAYSPHTYFETQHWLTAAAMLQMPDALFAGGKTYPTYRLPSTARSYLVDMLKGNLPGFVVPADDRALVFEGWEALCDRYAAPVFFEKSPHHLANWAALSLLLEWKARTAFNVKILFLVRNPLAVQYSASRLFGTPAEDRQFGWLETHRNLLALRAMLPPEDSLTLRYEDIVADPARELARIRALAGLPDHPSAGSAINADTAEKWRDDPAFTLALDPAVMQVASILGYSAEELHNPHGIVRQPRRGDVARTRIRRLADFVRNGLLRPARMRFRGGKG